jgi:hypothetical protein
MNLTGPLRTRRRWWVLAGVLVFAGVGSLWVGWQGHPVSLDLPATAQHPSRHTPEGASTAPPAPIGVPRSTPVALRIPAIGISVLVSQLGLNPDQSVQVPTDFQVPGWYELGPSPGQIGSAVILGHIDSHEGPAIFFNLRQLVVGDGVDVTLADGVVADFAVTSVAMYLKDQFPAQQVYGSHSYSGLQLVSCGGSFDSETGHYLSNIVVYTSLVRTTPPVPANAALHRYAASPR